MKEKKVTHNKAAPLPETLPEAQQEIVQLRAAVRSYEDAKRQRQVEEAAKSASPAAAYELRVFEACSGLEGLADGSEDYNDTNTRGRLCRAAIDVIREMHAELPKS